MHAIAHLLPALPGMTGPKTYAAWPVWRDSTTEPVTWQAMPKKAAVKLWHRARDFERRTRQPGQQDGALGRNGLAVLQTLIFDFLNFRTGRLDPGRPKIAKLAGISESSVQRGLVKLKAAGVLNWLRRCSGAMEDGRFILKQDTNAYAILPASQWRGYTLPPEPPEPHPATWGACPPLPDAVTAAAAERREGGSMADMLRHLESDPGDGLAAVLARLGRTMQGSKNP